MKDEKKTVGRDAPEPKRSGRLCKTSESGSGGQRTENPPGFSRGECQINGHPRNEPIKLTEDELQAMASALKTERHADGLSRKERRAALVAERKAVQDALGRSGKRR